jgi:transposase
MNRGPNRNLSVEEAVAVVTFAETGLSQRYIGHRLGVNQSTVSRVLRRHRETQEYSRRPGQERKRATTAAQDRFLMTLRERFITVPRLQKIQCNIVPTLVWWRRCCDVGRHHFGGSHEVGGHTKRKQHGRVLYCKHFRTTRDAFCAF